MTHADSLVTPYRSVRPVNPTTDGPWPGMLTCLPSGERRVFVDAELFGADWPGWGAHPHGHVLAAQDLVRREGGHDVVIDVCSEPLAAFLARRRASGTPLSGGEVVTVGVSLIRGSLELTESFDGIGEWWLTEAGRPVFAAGAGRSSRREATTFVLSQLDGSTAHSGGWEGLAALLAQTRVSGAEFDRAEAELFRLAAPLPLTAVGAAHHTRYAEHPWNEPASGDRAIRGPSLGEYLVRHVDANLGETISRTLAALWRTRHRIGGGRRAPAIVGLVTAIAVLGVGLAWPEAGPASPESPVASPSASGKRSGSPTPLPPTGSVPDDAAEATETGTDDLTIVATELIDRLHGCGEDEDCRALFTAAGTASSADAAINLPPDERRVVMLDDFGGVAVLRVEATVGATASQLIVIARENNEWLLRDVYDAAQQP